MKTHASTHRHTYMCLPSEVQGKQCEQCMANEGTHGRQPSMPQATYHWEEYATSTNNPSKANNKREIASQAKAQPS